MGRLVLGTCERQLILLTTRNLPRRRHVQRYGTDMRRAINRLTTGPRASRELSVRLNTKPSVCFCVLHTLLYTQTQSAESVPFLLRVLAVARCAPQRANGFARVSSTNTVTPTSTQHSRFLRSIYGTVVASSRKK